MRKWIDLFFTYWHTVQFMKPVQVFYQILYRFKKPFIRLSSYTASLSCTIHSIHFHFPELIPHSNRYLGNNKFQFLNQEKHFIGDVNWNEMAFGKLWNYNLQYFDYINDENIPVEERTALLQDFSRQLIAGKIKPEPYPVSLRLINTILFLSTHPQKDKDITRAVLLQVDYLKHNLEYHILANHLLENYITLLVAGFALKEEKLIVFAIKNLQIQLDEQILEDGGHYECSPMYHSIVLSRLLLILDCSTTSPTFNEQITWIKPYISKMLGWLETFQWSNGEWAHVNDATNGIAPITDVLYEAARALDIRWQPSKLHQSGYRRYNINDMELLVDVGNISPSYQPGHTHSDMLQVCLHIQQQPILVDTGTGTYQNNTTRKSERSTAAHNTVVVENHNQFQVWGSFRIGKRAVCTVENENNNLLIAYHDGYQAEYGTKHRRRVLLNDEGLHIFDLILHSSETKKIKTFAVFHFDYTVEVVLMHKGLLQLNKDLFMSFQGTSDVNLENYQQAIGFNKWKQSSKVILYFSDELYTKVYKA